MLHDCIVRTRGSTLHVVRYGAAMPLHCTLSVASCAANAARCTLHRACCPLRVASHRVRIHLEAQHFVELIRARLVDRALEFAQVGASRCRPHLRRDWARPCHICAGTGLAPATSAPGLSSP